MTEKLEIGKPYTGSAFRVNIENWKLPYDATAADMVKFEKKRWGSEYDMSDEAMEILGKYRHDDVIWVTKKKSEGKEYLYKGQTARDINKMELPSGSRVIAEDGEGGYLVLRGDAKPMGERYKEPEMEEWQFDYIRKLQRQGVATDRELAATNLYFELEDAIGEKNKLQDKYDIMQSQGQSGGNTRKQLDEAETNVITLGKKVREDFFAKWPPIPEVSSQPEVSDTEGGQRYEWQWGAEWIAAIPGEPIEYYCPVGDEGFDNAIAFLYETDEKGQESKYYIQMKDGTLVYNPETKSALFDDSEVAKRRFKMYTGKVKPGDHVVLQGIKDTYEGKVISVQDDTIRIKTPQWINMQWNKSAIKEVTPQVAGEGLPKKENKVVKRKVRSSPMAGYLE